MTNFPDFLRYGYRVNREIGHNRAGGRVTYQAVQVATAQPVVIKQFQFAKSGTTWSQYDSHHQEIQVLRGLNHPGIPQYLESFQTPDGFCMVQEYKQALPLSHPRSFDPEEIKQIAIAVLEILVYLQNRIPAVIHRDIKPENILVDDAIHTYLVDFGFARIGDGEVTVSSVVKGTAGFMPPEQLFNRELTEASDLYGLGATLICLLTQTKSFDIGNLVDTNYRINFRPLVPKLNIRWIKWLEKMVEPRPKDRFANAAVALETLKPIPVSPLPEVQLSRSNLELKALEAGAKLTQTITITNPALTKTLLEGRWEVAPHLSDPPHAPTSHPWISFQPTTFVGNQVECTVTVDTGKLRAGNTYERTILLHTNALPALYTLQIDVQTAPVPIQIKTIPYSLIALLLLFSVPAAWIITCLLNVAGTFVDATAAYKTATVAGLVIGLELAAGILCLIGARTGAIAGVVAGAITALGIMVTAIVYEIRIPISTINRAEGMTGYAIGSIAGLVIGFVVGLAVGAAVENFTLKEFSPSFAIIATLSTTALGISLGTGLAFGFLNLWIASAVLLTGTSLVILLLHQMMMQSKLIASYRRSERYLIKP